MKVHTVVVNAYRVECSDCPMTGPIKPTPLAARVAARKEGWRVYHTRRVDHWTTDTLCPTCFINRCAPNIDRDMPELP